jgi:superoxide dismutase
MSYLTRAQFASDANLILKVKQAMLTTALAVQAEAASVTNHDNRAQFALIALRSPDTFAPIMAQGVVTDTSLSGTSTDAELQAVIDRLWNSYSNAMP